MNARKVGAQPHVVEHVRADDGSHLVARELGGDLDSRQAELGRDALQLAEGGLAEIDSDHRVAFPQERDRESAGAGPEVDHRPGSAHVSNGIEDVTVLQCSVKRRIDDRRARVAMTFDLEVPLLSLLVRNRGHAGLSPIAIRKASRRWRVSTVRYGQRKRKRRIGTSDQERRISRMCTW